MSNCHIAEYPQDVYWFRLYDNAGKLRPEEIREKTGCYALVNLAYFAMQDIPAKGVKRFDHQSAIMLAGTWGLAPKYHEYGICIDARGRMTLGTERDAVYDYAMALPPVDVNGRRYTDKDGGSNAWTYTGLKADGTVVVWLNTRDNPVSSGEAEQALRAAGCVNIFRWDGSWSTQGILGPGRVVRASQYRCCRSWLLVFRRGEKEEEDKPVGKYKVTPEIGLNIRKSPDKGAAKVGGYPCGAVVEVLEEHSGWARTDRGWVYMAWLEPMREEETSGNVSIREDEIPKEKKNRPALVNPDLYITVHETGNFAAGADARAHASYLKGSGAEASRVSWHYTVDDHSVYRHLPDAESAYHATDGATGPGNKTSIGIEICVNAGGDFEKAKANAAALVRQLRERYGIPLDHVVQHHNWYDKDCPHTMRNTPGAWEAFLALCDGKEPKPDPLDEAVDTVAAFLAEHGQTMDTGYWKGGKYADDTVRALILKMAAALKER